MAEAPLWAEGIDTYYQIIVFIDNTTIVGCWPYSEYYYTKCQKAFSPQATIIKQTSAKLLTAHLQLQTKSIITLRIVCAWSFYKYKTFLQKQFYMPDVYPM